MSESADRMEVLEAAIATLRREVGELRGAVTKARSKKDGQEWRALVQRLIDLELRVARSDRLEAFADLLQRFADEYGACHENHL